MPTSAILRIGRDSLRRTGRAIAALAGQLDETFPRAVELILACRGHVVVSGGGTSAAIGRRCAHLLSCSGAPAFFLSPEISLHGSAAALTGNDLLIAISKGGETDELNHLAGHARSHGAPVIALTARPDSSLGRLADVVLRLDTPPGIDGAGVLAFGSSLAAGALTDALCRAVLSVRGYDADAFAQVHPGGAVGKELNRAAPRTKR